MTIFLSILYNTEANGMKTNVILENEKYVFKTLNLARLHLAKNFVYITAICIYYIVSYCRLKFFMKNMLL